MHKSLESIQDANFDVVREYLHTGKSSALNEEHKKMLDICVYCYGLLRDYPQRNVCIRTLMATKGLPYTTAARYVDFTRQTWGDYVDYRREFLEVFFLEKLMAEIASPDASEAVRSKNLATLQKFLDNRPADNIDPKLMEKNVVNIQVNLGTKSFVLNQSMLAALPVEVRQQILAAIDDSIDDAGAVALLES